MSITAFLYIRLQSYDDVLVFFALQSKLLRTHVISLRAIPFSLQVLGVVLARLLTIISGGVEAVPQDQVGYAITPDSSVYHLVIRETSRTLCGLPTTHVSDPGITLVVCIKPPDHGKLCRHCDDALDTGGASGSARLL